VELIASGPQLARRARKPQAEDVLASALDDPVVDEAACILAAELARLINALDPEAAVIGGGLGLARPFTQKLMSHTRPLIYAEDTRELALLSAALGNDAGIVGAALSVAGQASSRDRPERVDR